MYSSIAFDCASSSRDRSSSTLRSMRTMPRSMAYRSPDAATKPSERRSSGARETGSTKRDDASPWSLAAGAVIFAPRYSKSDGTRKARRGFRPQRRELRQHAHGRKVEPGPSCSAEPNPARVFGLELRVPVVELGFAPRDLFPLLLVVRHFHREGRCAFEAAI